MANRFQHLLLVQNSVRRQLSAVTCCFGLLLSCHGVWAENSGSTRDVDSELFELGFVTGVINVHDFGSGLTVGLSGTFKASENFFLQANYFQTDISVSSYEKTSSTNLIGDRAFQHYDLLVGYNLFQGEVFYGSGAGLSSLYLVAGVGDTDFGGESGFSYTLGVGYQMALSRRFTLRFDYRDYLYRTSLLSDADDFAVDSHMSVGLSWLF